LQFGILQASGRSLGTGVVAVWVPGRSRSGYWGGCSLGTGVVAVWVPGWSQSGYWGGRVSEGLKLMEMLRLRPFPICIFICIIKFIIIKKKEKRKPFGTGNVVVVAGWSRN
jgi:hypothetical protein